MAERKKANNPEKMSFEELMASLEAIVERIETGEIGLEDSLEEYERGVAMIRRGRQILSQVEQRVDRLKVDAEAASAAAGPPGGGEADESGERAADRGGESATGRDEGRSPS